LHTQLGIDVQQQQFSDQGKHQEDEELSQLDFSEEEEEQ
jgi:hypothetical protein